MTHRKCKAVTLFDKTGDRKGGEGEGGGKKQEREPEGMVEEGGLERMRKGGRKGIEKGVKKECGEMYDGKGRKRTRVKGRRAGEGEMRRESEDKGREEMKEKRRGARREE